MVMSSLEEKGNAHYQSRYERDMNHDIERLMNITEAVFLHSGAEPEVRFEPHRQPAYTQRCEDRASPRQHECQKPRHAQMMRQSQHTGKCTCCTQVPESG